MSWERLFCGGMFARVARLFVAVAFGSSLHGAVAGAPPIISSSDRFHPELGAQGMVVSRETLASEAGRRVLEAGGNAVDAAVTVNFVLGVTTPQAGNLGGGGFMLVHMAETGETVAIDYREKAPLAATRDMFLDEEGNADGEKSRFSHLAVGVPGTVAGNALALERFGTISFAQALAPAIELARDGFPVSRDLAYALTGARGRLWRRGAARETFFKEDGAPFRAGEVIKLPSGVRLRFNPAALQLHHVQERALYAGFRRGDEGVQGAKCGGADNQIDHARTMGLKEAHVLRLV